jgi:hypothetical protein
VPELLKLTDAPGIAALEGSRTTPSRLVFQPCAYNGAPARAATKTISDETSTASARALSDGFDLFPALIAPHGDDSLRRPLWSPAPVGRRMEDARRIPQNRVSIGAKRTEDSRSSAKLAKPQPNPCADPALRDQEASCDLLPSGLYRRPRSCTGSWGFPKGLSALGRQLFRTVASGAFRSPLAGFTADRELGSSLPSPCPEGRIIQFTETYSTRRGKFSSGLSGVGSG